MFKTGLTLAAALALMAPSVADDLQEPDWDRDDPRATFQHWRFDQEPTDPLNILPEVVGNQFGMPVIASLNGANDVWHELFGGRHGVQNFLLDFYIGIPNDPTPRDFKDIYVQITFYEDDSDPGTWDHGTPEVLPNLPGGGMSWRVDSRNLGGHWWWHLWFVRFEPNPEYETLQVIAEDGLSALTIDQIVVDTICTPTPGSLVMLGLAGLALRRRH